MSVPPRTDAGDVHNYYIHDKNDIYCGHYREFVKNRQADPQPAEGN
jgi:hypothetical protein